RAMTFAPRSWPSRPGFAMTTRIVLTARSLEHARRLPPRSARLAGPFGHVRSISPFLPRLARSPRPCSVGPHPPPSSSDANGRKPPSPGVLCDKSATFRPQPARVVMAGTARSVLSEHRRLAPHAPHLAQRVAHLAERDVCPRGVHDRRHEVCVPHRV